MVITAAVEYTQLLKDADGVYVWLSPDEQATLNLLRLLKLAPFKTFNGPELHATVIHSRDLPDNVVFPKDRVYEAVLEAFITWIDHKGRTIVVAQLGSPDLQRLHQSLVKQGLAHAHSKYNPHITVAKDIEAGPEARLWLAKINRLLESNEVIIKFSPQLRATPAA